MFGELLSQSFVFTPDFREGIDAFLAKRKPRWKGK